eukprot:1547296-Rhodomonas_salina.2
MAGRNGDQCRDFGTSLGAQSKRVSGRTLDWVAGRDVELDSAVERKALVPVRAVVFAWNITAHTTSSRIANGARGTLPG